MPHENPFTIIHLSPNTKKRREKLGGEACLIIG